MSQHKGNPKNKRCCHQTEPAHLNRKNFLNFKHSQHFLLLKLFSSPQCLSWFSRHLCFKLHTPFISWLLFKFESVWVFSPHLYSLAEAIPLSKCAPYQSLLPFSILGSPVEEQRHEGREKVPVSPVRGSISHHCWEIPVCPVLQNKHLQEEDTPPLWTAVCFGRSALSDIKISFPCKPVLVLSLGDLKNQSVPSFLHPASSK